MYLDIKFSITEVIQTYLTKYNNPWLNKLKIISLSFLHLSFLK